MEETYVFSDERFMSAGDKWRVLRAWRRFIRGGFRYSQFSKALYKHLHLHCSFIAHYNRYGFWQHYFDSDARRLAAFLAQFGGDGLSVEYGTRLWLGEREVASDLNRAMCREMEVIYPALLQVLNDLDVQYAELLDGWDDELQARFGTPPRSFQITQAVRDALAAASREALSRRREPTVQLSLWDVYRPAPDSEGQQVMLVGETA